MHQLHLSPVSPAARLVRPDEFHELSPLSSALEFFTDFKKHVPLTIDGSTPAETVETLMCQAHVKLKLVVDSEGEFIGTISLDDLDEQYFMTRVTLGIAHNEILVKDLMRPKAELLALNLAELGEANIDDVIKALQQKGQQHCLVVDQSSTQIRGMISASDIARRLRLPIRIEKVPTFADIFRSIKRPAA